MNELDELLSHSFEDIVNDRVLLRELFRLSENLLNLPYKTCAGTHRKYYEKLKIIKHRPMKNKVNLLDRKYILKPGAPLYYNHNHFYNEGEADKAHTLTDKIAANAIKKFPALAGRFLNERERAILEAKAAGAHNIAEAENGLVDDQFENEIVALIEAEEFDEARVLSAKLLVKKTREAALKAIDEAEAKKLADEKAMKAKKLVDKKAEADKKVEAKEEFDPGK